MLRLALACWLLSLHYFFQKNSQRRAQWNPLRRAAPWGRGPIPQVVLHTYEAPHTRSLLAAATYLLTRTDPGSYHTLAGANSTRDVLRLAPVSAETWHSVPSNKWAIGISAVAYAHQWNTIPRAARDNLVKSMAYAAYLASLELIELGKSPVPAKWITRADAMRGVWGFVMHSEMDPGRRSDAGSAFPRDLFMTEYRRLMGDRLTTTDPINVQEDDVTTPAQMDQLKSWIDTAAANSHTAVEERLPGLTWGYRNPSADRDAYAFLRGAHRAAAELEGQVAGLTLALQQLAGGQGVDLDAVREAAHDGAREGAAEGVGDAVGAIDADVTVTIKKED